MTEQVCKEIGEQVCKENGLGQGSMLDACGHDDELSSIKKNEEFLHEMGDYLLLPEDGFPMFLQ
jgi:hypothetical protein